MTYQNGCWLVKVALMNQFGLVSELKPATWEAEDAVLVGASDGV